MHVMIDCETWGTRPGCALRSIGAVTFELDGTGTGADYYRNINLQSCLDAGLKIEAGTLLWWDDQADEARRALRVEPQPLNAVLVGFASWFVKQGGEQVWAQGANFDPVLWETAALAAGVTRLPWKFYNVRDTRTLYELAGFDPRSIKRAGTYHNALDDARHQVACCQAAYRMLRPEPEADTPRSSAGRQQS
jgi:hypothetical protein